MRILIGEKGRQMKHQDRRRNGGYGDMWTSIAIAGAAMFAAVTSGGCLYTAIPAMAGGHTGSYQAPDDNQPAQSSQSSQSPQSSNDQASQNKQQSGAPQTSTSQNSAPPQGQSGGGATP
jgi:hypothetical protein